MPAEKKPSQFLVAGVASLLWLPAIAVAVLACIAFGWRVPVGIGAVALLFYGNARLEVKRRKARQRPIAWPLKMLAYVVLCTTVGWLLVDGVFGVALGLMLGVPLGLPPVSVRNKAGVVAPADPTDPVQQAAVNKTFGLFMAGTMSFFALALLIGILIERFA